MIEFVDLYNTWYILPSVSYSYDKDINGEYYYFYLQFSWLNKAVCINLIREK